MFFYLFMGCLVLLFSQCDWTIFPHQPTMVALDLNSASLPHHQQMLLTRLPYLGILCLCGKFSCVTLVAWLIASKYYNEGITAQEYKKKTSMTL